MFTSYKDMYDSIDDEKIIMIYSYYKGSGWYGKIR